MCTTIKVWLLVFVVVRADQMDDGVGEVVGGGENISHRLDPRISRLKTVTNRRCFSVKHVKFHAC